MSSVQNTLINLQNATNRQNFQRSRENLGTDRIGKDGFFRLLMAQLQYQNPLEPMDNMEFISQQVQFAQVEKLDQVNNTLMKSAQLSTAGSWVGRTVEYTLPNSAQKQTGVVQSVNIGKDSLALEINGNLVPPENVTKIQATPSG